MSDRYRYPDPKCRHKRKGLVFAGGGEGEAHASTQVCDRPECIEDAKAWVRAETRLEPTHKPDPQPKPPPTLFDGL